MSVSKEEIIKAVEKELTRSLDLHGPIQSNHEGIAVLEEEFLELRNLVYQTKSSHTLTPDMIKEAVQIAAMAIKFVCDRKDLKETTTKRIVKETLEKGKIPLDIIQKSVKLTRMMKAAQEATANSKLRFGRKLR